MIYGKLGRKTRRYNGFFAKLCTTARYVTGALRDSLTPVLRLSYVRITSPVLGFSSQPPNFGDAHLDFCHHVFTQIEESISFALDEPLVGGVPSH